MRGLSGRGAAIGALLLASASSLTLQSVALAQAQQAHAQRALAFNIAAQPLTQALTVFARQTGLKLAYPASLTSGKSAPALRGSYSVDEALDRLLAGSGLAYRFTGTDAATIVDPASLGARAQIPGAIPLETINVEGDSTQPDGYVATRSTAGSKTNTPIIEVPQTVNVVRRRQIVEQGAQSVGEALRYVPGVTTEPNGDTSRYDETRIRGFEPVQYLDGLRLPSYQFFAAPRIEVYGLERIEVLKGPGSALYGQSGPGGLLDMVTKRPTDVPLHEVALQGGSFDRKQAAFDFGGPLNADKTVLYRLTGVIRDGKTAVDFSRDDRYYLAPALTLRPTMDTTFTVLASLTRDDGTFPQNFLPAQGTLQFNPNGTIPASRFWGEPGTDRFRRDSAAVGYLFEHRFNDVFTVRQNLRYARTEVDFLSYYTFGLNTPDLRTLDRGLSGQRLTSSAFTVDNQVQADFNTGALRHRLLVGLDYQNVVGTYRHDFGCCDTIDIFAPTYGQPALPLTIPRNDSRQTQSQTGLYAQDQIKFQQWVLTLGGRYDQVNTDTQDFLAGTTGNQDDRAFTGRAGLTYLFQNGLAPYVSYATSFQPTLGIDRLGAPFRPTTGEQLEGGIKYQPPGTNALFTVAAFELRQQNALSPDPVDPTFNVQTAAVRVRGVEFEAKASVNRNLDVIASYAYLDARITDSSDPTEIGHRVPLTYEHQASLWGLYTFRSGPLNGLGIGAGLRYRGDSFSSNLNDIHIPSYVLVDGVISYDFAALDPSLKGARLAVNATNLFDRQHVVYCFGQPYCSYGAGRTVLATLSYRW